MSVPLASAVRGGVGVVGTAAERGEPAGERRGEAADASETWEEISAAGAIFSRPLSLGVVAAVCRSRGACGDADIGDCGGGAVGAADEGSAGATEGPSGAGTAGGSGGGSGGVAPASLVARGGTSLPSSPPPPAAVPSETSGAPPAASAVSPVAPTSVPPPPAASPLPGSSKTSAVPGLALGGMVICTSRPFGSVICSRSPGTAESGTTTSKASGAALGGVEGTRPATSSLLPAQDGTRGVSYVPSDASSAAHDEAETADNSFVVAGTATVGGAPPRRLLREPTPR